MTLRVSGKNVDIGDNLRTHVDGRIQEAIEKYFDGGFNGHVTIEREGPGFRTECAVHLDTGIVLQASASANEQQNSFDQAADRIEKRLRRYKRKLKNHHVAPGDAGAAVTEATSYVLASPDDDEEVAEDFSPMVIAETATRVKTMTVGMAVMELDMTEAPVVVFRNAGNGGVNVVYRRTDGHVGWIDPALSAEASSQ